MTGHIGARTNLQVALVTDDFRLYHRLAPFLEAHGHRTVGLRSDEPVPASVRVVVGGPPGDPLSVPLLEDDVANLLQVRAALDERPVVAEGPRHVVVGIDPGDTIGLAVVVDDARYWDEEAVAPAEAAGRVAAWRPALAAKHWSVHVGDGAPDVRDRILAELASVAGLDVHVVPEGASSPISARTTSRHTDAALLIARRRPT